MRLRILPLFSLLCLGQEQQPPVVDPGTAERAPSDAVVLFDGKNIDEWTHRDGRPVEWTFQDGTLICKSGTGDLVSKRSFGSAQIHLEFSTPWMPNAAGQARGNSGVYLQGRYEVQILDSFMNPTYANGSAGAVYGQYPPLVNASRPPEQWQSFDFIFHAPRCGRDGKVRRPATLTLLHNGVLIQDRVRIGITPGGDGASLCEPGPILLQDHSNPVRFRNIWVR